MPGTHPRFGAPVTSIGHLKRYFERSGIQTILKPVPWLPITWMRMRTQPVRYLASRPELITALAPYRSTGGTSLHCSTPFKAWQKAC